MSLPRKRTFTGAYMDPATGNAYANQSLKFTLRVPASAGATPMLRYTVPGDSADGTIIPLSSVTAPLDGSGTLGAGFGIIAPLDLKLDIGGVLTPSGAWYDVSGPGGLQFTTTDFAYSASVGDLDTVSTNAVPITYTTANVTVAVATPAALGASGQVVANLSTDCIVQDGSKVIVRAATPFPAPLNGAGQATLPLVPNRPGQGAILQPLDPSKLKSDVVWNVSVAGSPSVPIQVPAAGGALPDLLVRVVNGHVTAPPLGTFLGNFGGFL